MPSRYGSGSDIVDHILRERERKELMEEFIAMNRRPTPEEQRRRDAIEAEWERHDRLERRALASIVSVIVLITVVALICLHWPF